MHNYDAQQHRAGQIISPLTLQTITTAQMLSVGGEGASTIKLNCECMHEVQWDRKDTNNPPDINGASQTIRILRKLFNVFANHHGQFATSRCSQCVCQNASQPQILCSINYSLFPTSYYDNDDDDSRDSGDSRQK